jgi:hypothetical protein
MANFGLWIEFVLYERLHEKIFTERCILHNMLLLKLGERYGMSVVAGRGVPYANEGLWLKRPVQSNWLFMNETCPAMWIDRRDMLAEHKEYCKAIKGIDNAHNKN